MNQGFTVNGYTGEGSIDDVGDIGDRDMKEIARDKLIYATGSLRSVKCPHGEMNRPIMTCACCGKSHCILLPCAFPCAFELVGKSEVAFLRRSDAIAQPLVSQVLRFRMA